MTLQTINKENSVIEVKRKEEDSRATVTRKLKRQHVIERLKEIESGMIAHKSEIMKEVKSTNEAETMKKRIMIFNLKTRKDNQMWSS